MTKSEVLKSEILALCPEFATWDKEEWELWTDDDGTFSVHPLFSLFSHYISEKLEAKNTSGMDKLFRYIETK